MLNLARVLALGLGAGQVLAPSGPQPPLPSDVFSSSLWAGTGAAHNVVDGIDLATKGGMILLKDRDSTNSWKFYDTARGVNSYLPISTGSAQTLADSINTYNSDGFSLGAATGVNQSALNYVGYVFRKSVRFFDVVTYTGDGSALKAIPHSLGVTPGMVIIKRRDAAGSPAVSHIQSSPGSQYNLLNDPSAPTVNSVTFAAAPDATNIYVGTNTIVNASGGSYVAWIFAHDPTGIIQCGKYTGNGSTTGPVVTLGWQPQFLLIRRISGGTGNWGIMDTSRGMGAGNDPVLNPNLAQAETVGDFVTVSSTGFQLIATSASFNAAASDYIYMAIKA